MTEKSKTYYMKQGDSYPALELALTDEDGNALSLNTYYEYKLVVAPCVGGRRIIDMGALTLKNEVEGGQEGDDIGKVLYTWQPGDTDKPGEYLLEVILMYQGPENAELKYTVPRSCYDKLVITPRL